MGELPFDTRGLKARTKPGRCYGLVIITLFDLLVAEFNLNVLWLHSVAAHCQPRCTYADSVHLLWIFGADVGILGWSGSHCTPHAIRIGQLWGAISCLCMASLLAAHAVTAALLESRVWSQLSTGVATRIGSHYPCSLPVRCLRWACSPNLFRNCLFVSTWALPPVWCGLGSARSSLRGCPR